MNAHDAAEYGLVTERGADTHVGRYEGPHAPMAGTWVCAESCPHTDHAVACECCGLPWPTVRKYAGIGYWCDTCMNDGCFGDDIDAQNPGGSPPYYERRDANHARMTALLGGSTGV